MAAVRGPTCSMTPDQVGVQVEEAVSATGQLHTIREGCRPARVHNGSPRAVQPGGEARALLKCVQLRVLRRTLTSPAISYSFLFNNEKMVYYQLLWQSFGFFKKLTLLFVGV